MLKTITLTNFRKHENLTLDFVDGLNALRGPNEAGKSTTTEAITYAWFGAKALKESLSETVTYGKPETSLKVEMIFVVSGVEYSLKRSKGGAELRFGEDSVTGQTEVTRYVERLLGCTADIATKLMLANQSKIKGALEEGASGAVKLIETLADFDLIDQILQLVEAHLPSGNTKIMESRVAQLKLAAEEVIDSDLSELEKAGNENSAEYSTAMEKLTGAKAALDELAIVEARQILVDHARLHDKVETLQKDLRAVEVSLAEPLPAEVDLSVLPALREKNEAKKVEVFALGLHRKLVATNIEPAWEGTYDSFAAEMSRAEAAVTELTRDRNATELKLEKLQMEVIKDTTCRLCQKDLKDVPEVQLINNKLYPQITELKSSLQSMESKLAEEKGVLADLKQVADTHHKANLLYSTYGKYVEIDASTVPATAKWIGPIETDPIDYAVQIATLEAADKVYTKTKTAQEMYQRRKVEMEEALRLAQDAMKDLPLNDAADTIQLHKERNAAFESAKEVVNTSQRRFADAQAVYNQAKAVLAEKLKQLESVKADLKKSDADLDEMIKNNALIKKLRGARPQIATKLWQVVLGSVSHYFSQMRGVASVVTKDDDGFKVNGQSITGLSGSTLDILGLAIRTALTRTFLPNVQFLGLDEPASGCDEERETAMLGLITSCQFDQVLLVTHSALADSFAAKVITLGEAA